MQRRCVTLWLPMMAVAFTSLVTKPVLANDDSCRYAHDGECDEPRYCSRGTDCSDCGNCNSDPCRYANDGECDVPQYCSSGDYNDCRGGSGGSSDPCRYANDGECDVPQYCSSGDYNDCGSSGAGGGLHNTDVGDFVMHIAGCLFNGIVGMVNSVFTMLDMLGSVSEGDMMSVCEHVVDDLQSRGTARCNPSTLCTATGLLAAECDAIFMAICVLSDDVPNPCAWLMNQVTGGNGNICQTIADELHAAGQEEGSNCARPSEGQCVESGHTDNDCCIGSDHSHRCRDGSRGTLGDSCSLFGARLLCCPSSGHRRMLNSFNQTAFQLGQSEIAPWSDGMYKGVPVVVYEIVIAAMLKEIGREKGEENVPLTTVMQRWEKTHMQ